MMRNIAALTLGSLITYGVAAQGIDPKDYERSIELKDGGTVYVFRDGRMAYEDRLGRPVRVKTGATVETKTGEKLTVRSDDEGRLLQLQPRN